MLRQVRNNLGGFVLVAALSAGMAVVAIAQDAAIEKRTTGWAHRGTAG